MKASIWVGKWPARAKKLADTLGEKAAAEQLTKEMGRPISRSAVNGALKARYPDYATATKAPEFPKNPTSPESILRDQVAALEDEAATLRKSSLSEERIRREIFRLADAKTNPPEWLIKAPHNQPSMPGVPTLLVSDEHWGEVVDPDQVGGVNSYDLDEAHARLKRLTEATLDLLFSHTVNPRYPGMVLAFGGDGVTGDIHPELTATNDVATMPAVLDLFDHRVAMIDAFLREIPSLYIPCQHGNHGRNTKKIYAKGRAETNFDWLIYQMLERHYRDDPRVRIDAPVAPDLSYRIYNHRYLLTHGDRLGHGGDGIIGAIGPIIRGDQKKRSRNGQINRAYDTLLCGHWHQYMALGRVIVNGTLKGYDEYASTESFAFERPRQALWLTHPERGITISMPVYVDGKKTMEAAPWVSWEEKATNG